MPLVCWGTGWFSRIVIQHVLPEPQASLLSGILLGIEAILPPTFRKISASPARRTSLPSADKLKAKACQRHVIKALPFFCRTPY
jgi:hypothetical protein